MKNWFDEKRIEMLNKACEQVLSPQVQGPLSFADVIQLAGLLESHNTEATIRNAIKIETGEIADDTLNEMSKALVAETVQRFDSKTISNFTWGAEKEHVMDLSEPRTFGNAPAPAPTYVGDKLAVIPEKMRKILNYFPEDGENFVLATPVAISLLQCAEKAEFVASSEGAFKGPNNTMLVGYIDEVPIYSYFADYAVAIDPNDEDFIILGNYQKSKDAAVTQRLLVKNISFS